MHKSYRICAIRAHILAPIRHATDYCSTFCNAIQDLIDSGLVNLSGPSVTTNPLPTHSTHAVSSPSLQKIDLDVDDIDGHMAFWDIPGEDLVQSTWVHHVAAV